MFRYAKVLFLPVLTLILQACFAAYTRPLSAKGQDISGIWQGRSTSFADASFVNISFTLLDSDGEISGIYYCESGNTYCRNMNKTGTLSGNANAPAFRVSLDDSSFCLFYGGFLPDIADGHYRCYYHGRLLDVGAWNARLMPVRDPGFVPQKHL